MFDELTQESFQTGKAIVTVSVDLITAIADACKRSEQQNPGMSEEQKETLLGKVVDKVMSNYKETHGSLKGFNREGKDVTHIDVNDERTAELLEKACKKSVSVVQTGRFGAEMEVSLINDGPFTILLDSEML